MDYSTYIASLSPERKNAIEYLDTLITTTVPQLERYMQGEKYIGYGKYKYTYTSGRSGEWMVVGLASQKNYLSIYICMMEGDQYLPEKYAHQLGKVQVGRSCIRCKSIDDLNIPTLQTILKKAEKCVVDHEFAFINGEHG